MEDRDEELFKDELDYRDDKEGRLTYPLIVLNQINRITNLMSNEFHGGYFKEVTKKLGDIAVMEKTYIQDTREQFKNAVRCLYDLVYHKFDDRVKKEIRDEFELPEKELFNDINKELDEENITEAKNKIAYHYRVLFRILCTFLINCKYFKKKVEGE